MDATRTTKQLEETIDEFERQKIQDIKVLYFNCCSGYFISLKQWGTVNWNQTVMTSVVSGVCPHWKLFLFYYKPPCPVSCQSTHRSISLSLFSVGLICVFLSYRKSLVNLWQWKCLSMPRLWRSTLWHSKVSKVWMRTQTWRYGDVSVKR